MDIEKFVSTAKHELFTRRKETLMKCLNNLSKERKIVEYQRLPFINRVLSLTQTFPPLTDNEKDAAIDVIINSPVYDRTDAFNVEGTEYTDTLVVQLLKWFKDEFFKWVNKPECTNCGNDDQNKIQGIQPTRPYKSCHFEGKAGVIERYKCLECGNQYEFPRYNDICFLLKERRGRCGEWNNCFIAILRSLGIDTRYLWNVEDHVWCEYYSQKQERWIHLDSCENAYDKPLLYNDGWGKKMSYVFAINDNYIIDVSDKYLSEDHPQNHIKRDKITDLQLKTVLSYYNIRKLTQLNDTDFLETTSKLVADYKATHTLATPSSTSPLAPRQSGKGEWTQNRGEAGQ